MPNLDPLTSEYSLCEADSVETLSSALSNSFVRTFECEEFLMCWRSVDFQWFS